MNPRHALLVALIAGAWCLVPPVYASGNEAHGHQGTNQANVQASPRVNPLVSASAQAFSGNGDIVMQPGTAATTHARSSSSSSSGSSGNCGDNASGIGSLFAACESHTAEQGNSGDNGEAGMGWQSMLPGSIQ